MKPFNYFHRLMVKRGDFLKRRYLIIPNLILVLLITGCNLETKTFAEFYEKDLRDVSEIVIVDGNTGEDKRITDKDEIDSFLNKIRNIKFIPEENQEERDGFNYSISLFENNERTFQFGPTQVNENYYYTEPDIHPIINDFNEELKEK